MCGQNIKQDRQCTYEARSCNHCCYGKAISITYFVCVFVTLVVQYAMSMRIMSTVPYPTLHYFQYYLIKARFFFLKKKKVIEHKMCVLIFSTTFV